MTLTVLIVEDNGLNMKLFSELLQSNGYGILQSDGTDLDILPLVREHRPDLIVMDIQLPGISGLEHTKLLKAEDDLKDIPVIAVTAFALKGDDGKILEAGCDAYVAKPISIPLFLDTVARHIG